MRTVTERLTMLSIFLLVAFGNRADDSLERIPNDPMFAQQKVLFARLGVLEASKHTRGNSNVIVGVVENGFDFFHPDLTAQLTPGFYAAGGYHTECFDNMAHGTMVAGIIGACADNGSGMAGLAPRCRILTASHGTMMHDLLRGQRAFLRDHPAANLGDWQKESGKHLGDMVGFGTRWVAYHNRAIAASSRYLVNHSVRCINMSDGFAPESEGWDELDEAFRYADSKEVVIIMSAGNSAARQDDYPGDAETTIVAGACLLDDSRWEETVTVSGLTVTQGSAYGARLTVMAPVDKLVVCLPHEKRFYTINDGPMGASEDTFEWAYRIQRVGATSLAAPIVTSLVALVQSLRPNLSAKAVVDLVKRGCDDIGDKGSDEFTGHGRINFARTMSLVEQASAERH